MDHLNGFIIELILDYLNIKEFKSTYQSLLKEMSGKILNNHTTKEIKKKGTYSKKKSKRTKL